MDFDERYRADVMRYAAEKYGSDRVAQVITFSTIKARAAVRDAARVLGKPYIVGDRIAKAMPPLVMGRDTPLHACLTKTDGHEDGFAAAAELRTMHETDPDAKEVIDVALGPRGPAPPGRHPRRRRGHLPRPADRLPADPAQARRRREPRGRPHRHPVRNARGRGPRPAQDGLPRPAQPLGDRARPRPHRGGDGGAARHRRRRPGRRADARDAAAGRVDRACSSSRAARCARPCVSLAPTSFDDVAALVALYRPGSHGGQHAPRLPRAEERAQGAHLPAPRHRAHPQGHLRADALPGVGDAGRPEVRRLHASRRPTTCARRAARRSAS